MTTAMTQMIEWLQSYEYEIPLELQVKAKELLEKEKKQMLAASISGSKGNSFEQYYKQTYQNK
jgi:hypothetical protein